MHLPRPHPRESQSQHMQGGGWAVKLLGDSDAQVENQWLTEPSPRPAQQGFEACKRKFQPTRLYSNSQAAATCLPFHTLVLAILLTWRAFSFLFVSKFHPFSSFHSSFNSYSRNPSLTSLVKCVLSFLWTSGSLLFNFMLSHLLLH